MHIISQFNAYLMIKLFSFLYNIQFYLSPVILANSVGYEIPPHFVFQEIAYLKEPFFPI